MRLPPPHRSSATGVIQPLETLKDGNAILRIAAQSFFELLSDMCEGILVIDRRGKVVWVNERYERYLPTLGFSSPEKMIGREVEEVVPNSRMREVVKTGKAILLDVIENGEHQYVVTRLPLRDDSGTVIGAVGLILYDHLEALKPFVSRINRLQRALNQAQQQLAAHRRVKYNFSNFVGSSSAALEVKRRAGRAAKLKTTVLLLGETGTGKELVAQAIHAASPRASHPFIAVNVAAIPETLLEAEFFGVAPGAFTGADRRGREGKFSLAQGGTLLLDEIGDMPLALQVKLLRVLQEEEFEPLGSNQVVRADVRVIASTSRDLAQCVRDGTFRADLYYRLNVLPIRLPPLRERLEDLGVLCETLLERIVAINGLPPREVTPEALDLLAQQPWHGNVRELGNLLEQACLHAEHSRLGVKAFTRVLPELRDHVAAAGVSITPLATRIAELERQAIREALATCHGNKAMAAKRLGISRTSLYQKLQDSND